MDRIPWTNPAVWLFWIVLLSYAVASVAALWLEHWRLVRCVPIVSVLAALVAYFVPASNGLERDTRFLKGVMVSLVLMCITLIWAWSGRRFTERVLRVTSI